MTTTSQPTPPPPVHVPIERRRRARSVPVTIGAVLAAVGSVLALAGGSLLVVAGDDGTIGSGGSHDISTNTSALVSDAAKFEDTGDIASALGEPRLGLTATARDGGPDKFVGAARKADVDRYLAGAAVERVTDASGDPFELEKHREGGNATPAAPTTQSFWVAQSAGQRADVNWRIRDGEYRFVVMNADGSRGVSADGHLEAGAQYLSTIALAALLAGLMTLGGGIVLIARNAKVPVRAAVPAPVPTVA